MVADFLVIFNNKKADKGTGTCLFNARQVPVPLSAQKQIETLWLF